MIKCLADQNFDGRILRGLILQIPELNVLRVEDIGLKRATDIQLLDWAKEQDRVILTHDQRTFPPFVTEKIKKGEKVCGIILVASQSPIGRVLDDLVIAITCKLDDEWENNITRIPF